MNKNKVGRIGLISSKFYLCTHNKFKKTLLEYIRDNWLV